MRPISGYVTHFGFEGKWLERLVYKADAGRRMQRRDELVDARVYNKVFELKISNKISLNNKFKDM